MKKKLIALANISVAGIPVTAGQPFEIESEQDANYLVNGGRAKLAEESQATDTKEPAKKKPAKKATKKKTK